MAYPLIGHSKRGDLFDRLAWTLVLCIGLLWLAGCNGHQPSNEEIRQQTAKTTQQVKQEAQKVAANAKTTAQNAADKVDAFANGVKEGVKGKPAAVRVDINSASEAQLAAVEGIGGARARRIVRGRPYQTSHDLVSKGILTEGEFARIEPRIVAN